MTEFSGEVSVDFPKATPGVAIKAQRPSWGEIFKHPFQKLLDKTPVPLVLENPAPPAESPRLPGESERAWQIRTEKRKRTDTRYDETNTSSGRNPLTAQLESKGVNQPPTARPAIETPDIIKPAEQGIVKPATPPETPTSSVADEEPEPWKPVFSQELMDRMVQRSPASLKTLEQIEQERVNARAGAAIARAGKSKAYEAVDHAAIKPEKPSIIERAATLREGVGRRTARVQEAITTAREDRAGNATIQTTLRTIAAKPAEQVPSATAAANEQYRIALAKSYDRNAGKGVTEPSADTTITDAQAKIASAFKRVNNPAATADTNVDTVSVEVVPDTTKPTE
jgi:hypothetical protein